VPFNNDTQSLREPNRKFVDLTYELLPI